MTVEPDAARPAHRTDASIAETHAPDLAPRPAARASRDGSVRLDEPPPWTGLQRSPLKRAHAATLVGLLCVGAVALGVAGHALYDQYFGDTERAAYAAALTRRHTAIAMRPDGASYAPAVSAGQPTLALLTGLLPNQAGTGPLSTHTGKGEAAAAAPAWRAMHGRPATHGTISKPVIHWMRCGGYCTHRGGMPRRAVTDSIAAHNIRASSSKNGGNDVKCPGVRPIAVAAPTMLHSPYGPLMNRRGRDRRGLS